MTLSYVAILLIRQATLSLFPLLVPISECQSVPVVGPAKLAMPSFFGTVLTLIILISMRRKLRPFKKKKTG